MAKTNAYTDVFQRYEKKYMLTAQQYIGLRVALDGTMQPDAYGRHTISNLYYDTEQYDLIRASIERPVYKEKLRLRCYGLPKEEGTAFLELKKKFKGVVYKRRVALPLCEAAAYLNRNQIPAGAGQILHEVDWFRRMHPVEARVMIAYDRVALAGRENPELRMTFDTGIRWRDTMLDLTRGDWGAPLLAADRVLMELKIPGAIPIWLSGLLDRLEIRSTSYSKYGACYQRYLWQQVTAKGGSVCA